MTRKQLTTLCGFAFVLVGACWLHWAAGLIAVGVGLCVMAAGEQEETE